jgi:probable rRNA maturation factor
MGHAWLGAPFCVAVGGLSCDSIRDIMFSIEPPRGSSATTDPWVDAGLSRAGLSRFLRTAQGAVGLSGEVEVLLAGDRTVRRLNREFRGKDAATDVLSFPAAAEFGGGHAGDLAISLETAGRQAAEHGHSLRDEVRVLLLHGLLHLAGMDHEVEGGEMAVREGALRKRLGLKRGLIARVGGTADPYGMTTRKAKTKATVKGGATRKRVLA